MSECVSASCSSHASCLAPIANASSHTVKAHTLEPALERIDEFVACAHLEVREVDLVYQEPALIVHQVDERLCLFFDVRACSFLCGVAQQSTRTKYVSSVCSCYDTRVDTQTARSCHGRRTYVRTCTRAFPNTSRKRLQRWRSGKCQSCAICNSNKCRASTSIDFSKT